jgi:hypothetical protein
MVVRIRFAKGPKIRINQVTDQPAKNRQAASALAALLTPVGLIALVLAIWRVAADLNWANSFAIPTGLFSHWQVWLAAAALVQFCSYLLNRYGNGDDAATS